jgi:hypothetical protein
VVTVVENMQHHTEDLRFLRENCTMLLLSGLHQEILTF